MAGGAGAAVVGGLLAGSQLPQLRAVLEAEPLAAQLDARALLRLLKAFLQARTRHPGTAYFHEQSRWCRAAGRTLPTQNPGMGAGELRAQQRAGARRAPGVRAAARRPLRARVGGRAALLPDGAGGRGQRRGAAAGLRAGQHAEPAVWHAQGDRL